MPSAKVKAVKSRDVAAAAGKRSLAKATGKAARAKPSQEAKRRATVNPKRKTVPLQAMEDATFYHVIKRGDKWEVMKQGAGRASGLYATKSAAVSAARTFKVPNKHIFVHKADGTIAEWIRSRAA